MKKNNSMGKNMVLYGIKNLMSLLFPLITFPYVSKTLSVDSLGKYNFCNSIVGYFSLLAALGISNYAIREGAMIRDKKEKIGSFVKEIFSINIISMTLSYVLFFLSLIFVGKFASYRAILLVFSVQILFATIGVEWIFGIYEDFLFVTVRSIVFQFISLILLVLFVKGEQDVLQYAFVTVLANGGANILNLFYSKKFVRVGLTRKVNLRRHIKPILIIFATAIACTIYVNSDVTILGFLCTDYHVGIYSVSTKIYTIMKTLASAVLMVAIPGLSYEIGKNDYNKYKLKLNSIFKILTVLMIPLVTGVIMLREQIVLILADESYMQASTSLVILSIALPICLAATFAGQCVLLPLKKEKVILFSTMISAVVNVVLNFILIPHYQQDAAAFTTLLAELCAMVIQWYYVIKYLDLKSVCKTMFQTILGALAIVLICSGTRFIENMWAYVGCSVFFSVFGYGLVLLFLKNEVVENILRNLVYKIKEEKEEV